MTETDACVSGAICAVAAQGQRDLQEIAAEFGDLFPARPFDAGVFSTLAMANAFSAPWLAADDLRMVNRSSLWAFRVDWLVDYLATSAAEVNDFAARSLAVADGAEPDDPLTTFLARIRDDLTTAPGFTVHRAAWREELRRMLDAMAREWAWKAAGAQAAVTVEAYLANADNLGSSFVNLSHWLANPDAAAPSGGNGRRAPHRGVRGGNGQLDDVLAATRAQQRVIRIVNDLATVDRDLRWSDLNVMMLGPSRTEAAELVATLTATCREQLDRLTPHQPKLATFLARQLDFCRGFYGITDYWGEL